MVSIYILNKDTNLKDLLDNNNNLKTDLTNLFSKLIDQIKQRDVDKDRTTNKCWENMSAEQMLQKILQDKDYDNASKWLFVIQHDTCIGLLRMVHNYDQNLKNAIGKDYVEISNLVINTDKCGDNINIFEEMIEHAIKNIINDKNICNNCKVIINVDEKNKKVEAKLKKRGFIRLLVSYPVYLGLNPFRRINYIRRNLLGRDLLFHNHF